MMMKPIAGMLFFLMLMHPLPGQDKKRNSGAGNQLTVVFYNVENLFDTTDDPLYEDDEFLPRGDKEWTEERFNKKIEDLSGVIHAINPEALPEILGLCEVENRFVLEQLVQSDKLESSNYQIIHEDGPDERGIDVAFLYNPESFRPESYRIIPVDFPRDTMTTRDILYVKGTAHPGETFHFFVNHWKSRSGGMQATENKRIYSSVLLRKAVDSIISFDPGSNIVIMGDLNDEPTNISIHHFLRANNKRKNADPRDLFNLFYDMHNLGDVGTYHYQGNWNMLDQIIISQTLLDGTGFTTTYEGGKIFKADFLLYDNPKANARVPDKTYGGTAYYGGISDHLPVYVVFEWR
jgi:predicted extracellular nuclease